VDTREVVNALRYLERTGCQWRHLPRRWVIERSFAGHGRARRLSKDHEARAKCSESHVYFASIHRLLRRISTDLAISQVAA
jgi:putative transposase